MNKSVKGIVHEFKSMKYFEALASVAKGTLE